ncbi:MAG: hypothetical protein LBI64_03065 [Coriobacteriales bacterium]|jgi:hypothetical protein|nr:hypothetical protein [Coriobacteriales bacterium]
MDNIILDAIKATPLWLVWELDDRGGRVAQNETTARQWWSEAASPDPEGLA